MQRVTGLLMLSVFAAIMLGCSGQSGTDNLNRANPGAAVLGNQLPPLPQGRQASVLMDFTQLGQQALWREASAVDEGTALRLASTSGAICWGAWGFSNAKNATTCVVDYSGVAGAQAYFAISDYTKGVWELRGPLPGPQQTITINDPRYSNASGDLFIAVIAFNGASILVDQLKLTADIAPITNTIDFTGGFTSLAMVNGNPAISYYDEVNHDLRYVRALDIFGSVWGVPLTLDSTGDTGRFTSLKVVDGNPAIAYYDTTAMQLRYIRAMDADGTTWGTPVTVATSVTTGEYCSLDVVAGNPAISYYDFDSGDLRYVRALDSTGATWGAYVSPDSDGNTGFYSSLEVVDGFPAISYRNGSAGQLWYVRATDAEGATWDVPVMVDGNNNAGNFSSLAVVNGSPAICYYSSTMGDLMYVRALTTHGGSWGTPLQLDGAEDEGSYCSLAVIGGVPTISYHGGLHGDLRYIKALDQNGDSWGSGVILDESSNLTGRDTSLCEVYGMPGVSYFDQTNGKLQYMWGF
jgi:hypothetical protein